jgi:hypothetical protein
MATPAMFHELDGRFGAAGKLPVVWIKGNAKGRGIEATTARLYGGYAILASLRRP